MRYFMSLIGLLSLVACNGGSNDASMIASAKSAGPASVTSKATIKAPDGKVLQTGSNSYTCYPQQEIIGPMCNEAVWDALIGAMLKKESFEHNKFSVSYMLAGEGTALGVSCSKEYPQTRTIRCTSCGKIRRMRTSWSKSLPTSKASGSVLAWCRN